MGKNGIIILDNGVQGIYFYSKDINAIIKWIRSKGKNTTDVLAYFPKTNTYLFGKDKVVILEGNAIIYNPKNNSFYMSRNSDWINDYNY